ncbi:MAG: 16S rRNA (cytosine(1402)-N(4))-methyltransferase RsmH [Lachnospiraceae bacterium]|nr:16S rRNA (cytosine(1402)-N(4))-methyltransferase RsmH [Lachnospiraceae bacterium]
MDFDHIPVMLQETLQGLNIRPDGIYVDGTVGGAGHSLEIAKRLNENGRLIGIDQDEEAVETASERLKGFANASVVRSNYIHMRDVLWQQNIERVDGILLDLGVSSHQLDDAERGFSYNQDAPLDMRMDQRKEMTAGDIVNTYDESELYHIIRDYGEDRFAKNIAKHIVIRRNEKPIETTLELADIVKAAIPAKFREKGGNPAKRTFQAIRIELNRELDVLREGLTDMLDLLNDNGRICVITFHSLEDRIVKEIFKNAEDPCTCPPEFPVCVCGKKPLGRMITRRVITPSEEELATNKRSSSAKLRVFERHFT